MRIYLDVCCLNRPYDDQTQDRIRLEGEAIESIFRCFDRGEHEWVSSVVVEDEVSLDPNPERRGRARARFLHLFDSGSGDYTEERHAWLDGQTLDEIAERIRKREGHSS